MKRDDQFKWFLTYPTTIFIFQKSEQRKALFLMFVTKQILSLSLSQVGLRSGKKLVWWLLFDQNVYNIIILLFSGVWITNISRLLLPKFRNKWHNFFARKLTSADLSDLIPTGWYIWKIERKTGNGKRVRSIVRSTFTHRIAFLNQ